MIALTMRDNGKRFAHLIGFFMGIGGHVPPLLELWVLLPQIRNHPEKVISANPREQFLGARVGSIPCGGVLRLIRLEIE